MQHESQWGSPDQALPLAGGSNYSVPVPGAVAGALAKDSVLASFEDDLSRTIVDLEVNADQWTLMHRYNKAAELIEQSLQARAPRPARQTCLISFVLHTSTACRCEATLPGCVLSVAAQSQQSAVSRPTVIHATETVCVRFQDTHTLTHA